MKKESAWCERCDKVVQTIQCFKSKGRRGRKVVLKCVECHRDLGKPTRKDLSQAIANAKRGIGFLGVHSS